MFEGTAWGTGDVLDTVDTLDSFTPMKADASEQQARSIVETNGNRMVTARRFVSVGLASRLTEPLFPALPLFPLSTPLLSLHPLISVRNGEQQRAQAPYVAPDYTRTAFGLALGLPFVQDTQHRTEDDATDDRAVHRIISDRRTSSVKMFSANENIALRQHKRRVTEYVESTIPGAHSTFAVHRHCHSSTTNIALPFYLKRRPWIKEPPLWSCKCHVDNLAVSLWKQP